MREIYETEKQTGMYMVIVDLMHPLTFNEEHMYKINCERMSRLVKVTDSKLFNKYLKDLCETSGAKVNYYFISKLEDVLEL